MMSVLHDLQHIRCPIHAETSRFPRLVGQRRDRFKNGTTQRLLSGVNLTLVST
jgi:hypothetical protein